MPKAVTSPKSTGGEGYNYEDQVVAYYLLHLLTGHRPFEEAEAIIRVDQQTRALGWHLDDVLLTARDIHGQTSHYATSIKSYDLLTYASDLKTLARECWEQYLHVGSTVFAVDRDRFLFAFNMNDGGRWRALGDLLRYATAKDPGDLDAFIAIPGTTNTLVRDLYSAFACPDDLAIGKESAETQTGNVLRHLRVIKFDFGANTSESQLSALNLCKQLLGTTETELADELWRLLVSLAKDGRARGATHTLLSLNQALPPRLASAFRSVVASSRQAEQARMQALEKMQAASRARCQASWRALNLDQSKARELAFDNHLGDRADVVKFDESDRVMVLTGEFGIGKTLHCERWLQYAIADSTGNPDAAVPVYLEAGAVHGRLEDVIVKSAAEIGDVSRVGARIVIEKADEVSINRLLDLITQSAELSEQWPNTDIIIACRPLESATIPAKTVVIPPLDDGQWQEVVQRTSGVSLEDYQIKAWSKALGEMIRRPLFAVLAGVWIATNRTAPPGSVAALLSQWIGDAMQSARGATDADTQRLLYKLAVLSVASDGAAVPSADVGDRTEIQAVLRTGLVAQSEGTLRFPLPILTQWFAAHALRHNYVTLADIATSSESLERWKYSLVLYLSIFDLERVDEIMVHLAVHHPAFGAEIVRRASRLDRAVSYSLPAWDEVGRRLIRAMSSWVYGVGPLAHLIAPVRPDGSLRALGVHTNPEAAKRKPYEELSFTLYFCWCSRDDVVGPLVPFTPGYPSPSLVESVDDGWRSHYGYSLTSLSPIWHWQEMLEILIKKLDVILDKQALPTDASALLAERRWDTAAQLIQHNSWQPIPLAVVARRLEQISRREPERPLGRISESVSWRGWNSYVTFDYGWLASDVKESEKEGVTMIEDPWLPPDLLDAPGPQLKWTGFSRDRLRQRIAGMVWAALESYRYVARERFSSFQNRMWMLAMMPCRVRVYVYLPFRKQDYELQYEWYVEALPKGQVNDVVVEIIDGTVGGFDGQERMKIMNTAVREAMATIVRFRPETLTWARSYRTQQRVLDIRERTFVTRVVYMWLRRDMELIAWAKDLPRGI